MTLYEIDFVHGTITPWDVPEEKTKRFDNTLEFTDSQGVVRRLYRWIFTDNVWKAVRAAKEVANAEAELRYKESIKLINLQFTIQPLKS